MSLRRRLIVLCAAAVSVSIILVAVVSYVVVRDELRNQVDTPLRDQAALARDFPTGQPRRPPRAARRFPAPPQRRGGAASFIQIVEPTGTVRVLGATRTRLPVTADVRAVADGRKAAYLSDQHIHGEHVRMIVARGSGGRAIQLARSLESVDGVLRRLRVILILVCLAGIALSALLARLVSRNVLAPIADLTDAAEHIEATGDLARRIMQPGSDEVGRLAARFNAMLDRIDASVAAQRQLVADASHELRTPVTSLRTNVEVLQELDDGTDGERRALLSDVVAQSEELGRLIGDVIELARGDEPATATEDVRLDDLVTACVERARRHHPRATFTTALAPVTISGVPDRLERAVNNLLDNAATHGGSGGVVEVALAGAALTIRDHGLGIDPAEAEHVFDRFFRGAAVRRTPGSGLGLAIVKQVAQTHGATVSSADAPGGGTVMAVTFPVG